jgi:hypothetical protein
MVGSLRFAEPGKYDSRPHEASVSGRFTIHGPTNRERWNHSPGLRTIRVPRFGIPTGDTMSGILPRGGAG